MANQTPIPLNRQKIHEIISVISVSDVAYNATSWDGVTTISPSKNAVRDKIESVVSSIPVKASGAEINTSTDDAKFATPKAMADSDYITGSRGDEVYIPNIPASGGDGGGVTLGTKEALVDGDILLIYDSEDSNAIKTTTLANLRTYLDNYYVRI